jgi:hypothetical protein
MNSKWLEDLIPRRKFLNLKTKLLCLCWFFMNEVFLNNLKKFTEWNEGLFEYERLSTTQHRENQQNDTKTLKQMIMMDK